MQRIPSKLVAALLLLGFGVLHVGCTSESDDSSASDPNGYLGPYNNDDNNDDKAEEPRKLRNAWLEANVGDAAAYRLFTVPGDDETAEEERWLLLDPTRLRVYTGGTVTLYGVEPAQTRTRHIEVPGRASGVSADNWWYSEHAVIPADEASLPELELESGQRVAVLEVPLDDGSTVWVSEAAPLDRIVRHETADGELQRELLAHGRWLGIWLDEATGELYSFGGTEAIVDEEGHAYTVTEETSAGGVTLALRTEAGEDAGTVRSRHKRTARSRWSPATPSSRPPSCATSRLPEALIVCCPYPVVCGIRSSGRAPRRLRLRLMPHGGNTGNHPVRSRPAEGSQMVDTTRRRSRWTCRELRCHPFLMPLPVRRRRGEADAALRCRTQRESPGKCSPGLALAARDA